MPVDFLNRWTSPDCCTISVTLMIMADTNCVTPKKQIWSSTTHTCRTYWVNASEMLQLCYVSIGRGRRLVVISLLPICFQKDGAIGCCCLESCGPSEYVYSWIDQPLPILSLTQSACFWEAMMPLRLYSYRAVSSAILWWAWSMWWSCPT